LTGLDDLLPRRGRALDVAGGTGRHALWLARRGLDTTLADVPQVALEKAAAAASEEGWVESGRHEARLVARKGAAPHQVPADASIG
jgi:ubiquinone/menaquinone biosynthesis C-methylase UbiE